MDPDITVITTVYNCENYIEESVRSITEQTYNNFEYIIVDDGSTDSTFSVISKLASKDKRIIIIRNENNIGRVRSLNISLERAGGKYIAIQDADDISLPQRLIKQYSFLNKNPAYVLVGADVTVINEEGIEISHPVRPEKDQDAKFSLLFRCTFANPSIMFRKDICDKFNIRYDENFLHAEDFRVISLISRHGKVFNMREKLVKYRKHESNNSTVNFKTLNHRSSLISADNLLELGFALSDEQIKRMRNMISSRGIDKNFLLNDVRLIFSIIKKFQIKNENKSNDEILKTLKRMTKWLGKKNVFTKREYFKLQISILNYYYKQVKLNKQNPLN